MGNVLHHIGRHRFHGDPARFEVVADFVGQHFSNIRYVADVAGGQGMLSRILKKKHQIESEVIDPRGWALRGVVSRCEEFSADMADYYDLIIGLHPDQALRQVVLSARSRPVLVIPCCNFWSEDERLGRDALLAAIEVFHREAHGGHCEKIVLGFRGPYNRGLLLT
jgi:hypothetical protein